MMYARTQRARAAAVAANKASTSRESIHKSDIEAEAVHEQLTGINRAMFDQQLHAEANRIRDRTGESALVSFENAKNLIKEFVL